MSRRARMIEALHVKLADGLALADQRPEDMVHRARCEALQELLHRWSQMSDEAFDDVSEAEHRDADR